MRSGWTPRAARSFCAPGRTRPGSASTDAAGRAVSQKVHIPFTFVVRKVTWRPAGEALPAAPQGSVLTGLNGQALPLDAKIFPEPGVLDALTEQGKREYYEGKAVKAGEARRQAREAKAARWEPMPTSGGASRLTASLFGNLRRPR